ncbi:MAG: HlyD family secretion protein [Parashewanella sp.]
MKIELNQPHAIKDRRNLLISIGVATLLAITSFLWLQPDRPSIALSELKTVEVKQADIDVLAPVYGEYVSQYERLVSAPEMGKVSEIYLRAGVDVTADSIIAKLSNPELEQQLLTEKSKLADLQASFQSLELEIQNQQLEMEAELAEIGNQIQIVELDLNANQKLAELGIVAKIELERAKLKHQQLTQRLSNRQFRFSRHKQRHDLQLRQQHNQVKLQRQQVQLVVQQVQSLQIRAGISGTLQKLQIEIGQQLNRGASIAKVGSKNQLMVKLRIPQRLAAKVKPNALVQLKTQDGLLTAKISQLNSVIENNFVYAQAIIDSELPENVRPAQAVNAYVFIEHKANALFVEQRAGIIPLSTQVSYIHSNQTLQQIKVQFAELSKGKVLVNNGLKVGDKLVINNLAELHQYTTITVK